LCECVDILMIFDYGREFVHGRLIIDLVPQFIIFVHSSLLIIFGFNLNF